jgi:hypothetical protein
VLTSYHLRGARRFYLESTSENRTDRLNSRSYVLPLIILIFVSLCRERVGTFNLPTSGVWAQPMKRRSLDAILDNAAADGQPLNWRLSIVDLVKLLQLDSSLEARRALATKLGYASDLTNTTVMNVWLHKQIMTRLANNHDAMPAELES